MKPVATLLSALAVTCAIQAKAAVASTIDGFDFYGDVGNETSDAPTTVDPGVTASNIFRGTGFNVTTPVTNSFSSHAGGYGSNAAQAEADNTFDYFSLSPTAGNTLSLSNVTFNFYGQDGRNTYPNFDTALEYSLDGTNFTVAPQTESYSGSDSNPGTASDSSSQAITASADLTGITALQNVSGPVYFRIDFFSEKGYDYLGIGTAPGNSQTLANNAQDLLVTGTVTGAPEPASLGITAVAAIGLLARRRRH